MTGRSGRGRRLGFLLLAVLTFGLAACSPEGARTRGGGAGADVGNRDGDVELTGDEDRDRTIYHETPDRLPVLAEGAVE